MLVKAVGVEPRTAVDLVSEPYCLTPWCERQEIEFYWGNTLRIIDIRPMKSVQIDHH